MYTFIIKDEGPDLDIVITRAMLALTAVATLVYRTDHYYYLNLLSAFVLVISAIFIKALLVKFRITRFALLTGAAVILFIATRSVIFAVILLVYGYFFKFLNRKPMILVTGEGVTVKKLLSSPAYQWNEFSNIILKDNLLTIDFKNNKLIQVSIDESKMTIDEKEFNEFCSHFMQ
ncbi:MAG: hypothetical protein ABIQ31_21320 [Ferruginibacter sp.]